MRSTHGTACLLSGMRHPASLLDHDTGVPALADAERSGALLTRRPSLLPFDVRRLRIGHCSGSTVMSRSSPSQASK